jgi:hypothetical protein
MQKPINLEHLARLAEHLDGIGERQAAIMARADLALLRDNQTVPYERLLHVAAELVHSGDTLLGNVRAEIGQIVDARNCEIAAAQGGPAVAELLDAVIALAVRLVAPYRNASRVRPEIGEQVVYVDLLPDLAGMDEATLAAHTGEVREIGPTRLRDSDPIMVLVRWPRSSQWVNVEQIAAVRMWRQP